LIVKTKPELVVEIGVFGGKSLVPQALTMKWMGRGKIVGIDPWSREEALVGDEGEGHARWWSGLDFEGIYRCCLRAIENHQVQGHCELLRMTSEQAALRFLPSSIDILHIDGNHSEGASCRDVELWVPRLRGGGHLWFDDADWASTQRAVAVLNKKLSRIENVGNCFLYQNMGSP
jgi:hypothetical protein